MSILLYRSLHNSQLRLKTDYIVNVVLDNAIRVGGALSAYACIAGSGKNMMAKLLPTILI